MAKLYLIQRGEIIRPLASKDVCLSHAVDLDYMGSAEFEFGALPKSFRRIEAKATLWVKSVIDEITDDGKPLRLWSALNEKDLAEYISHLKILRDPNQMHKVHLKESAYFEAPKRSRFQNANFWWDIENDVMFTFDKNFGNAIGGHVAASLVFMNWVGR